MIEQRFAGRRLNQEEIEKALHTILAILQSQAEVGFAYLHGSLLDFQRGEQSFLPHDIDVAVYLTGGDWVGTALRMQLEFYRSTGLSPEVFDVHPLNNAPLETSMEIIKHGKLLFCRDSLLHSDFLENVSNTRRRLSGILEAAHA